MSDKRYPTCYGSGSYRGGDVVFVFVPPTSRVYSFTLNARNINTASLIGYLALAAPCSTAVSVTSSSYFIYQDSSARSFSGSAGVPMFIVVDSDVGYEDGFTLTIN